MKKLITVLIALFILFSAINIFSQEKAGYNDKKSLVLPKFQPVIMGGNLIPPKIRSLFNPEKFQMTQSYSMSFASGDLGGMSGLYRNTINYKLSDSVKMRFQFGFFHNPMASGSGISTGTNISQ